MSENEIIVKLCNRCNEEKDILMWGIDNIKKGNRYSESNQDKYEKN